MAMQLKRRLSSMQSFVLAIVFLAGLTFRPAYAQEAGNAGGKPQGSTGKALSASDELAIEQNRISDRYARLEDLLFKLAALEESTNPRRAALLKRAVEQSKERLTKAGLEKVAQQLSTKQLKRALDGQSQAKGDLEALLTLLQSEDRSERLKSEQERVREYIKEVERLLRLQKSALGQTQSGAETEKLAEEQKDLANRTGKLATKIRETEEAKPTEESKGAEEGKEGQENPSGKPKDPSPMEKKPSGDQPSDANPSQEKPGEEKTGEPKTSEGKPGENKPKPGDMPPDEGKPSESKPKEDKGDEANPPMGKPGETPQGDGGPSKPSEQEKAEENPARKRLENAEEKMRDAQLKLEKAKRKESIEDQLAAKEELEKAKAELERILRQMREEEQERALASLEARFRKMLEMQMRVYESTRRLETVVAANRNAEFLEQASKLGIAEGKIVAEAQKALTLMLEEGSSVAFPATVEQMRDDMQQVGLRLGDAKVDEVTLGLEEDVISTLEELIDAVQKAQQDLEQRKREQNQNEKPDGKQQQQEEALISKIAELKMIKSLQERVNKRTSRYARLLEDDEDKIGQAQTDELRTALQQLAEKQQEIFRITKDVVQEKNK
ncbi:MAG: hypothetical protein ACO1RA_22340 [Planctomycetaceae bacterium]